MDENSSILPYRVDGSDLTKLVDGRARGRSLEGIRAAGNFSAKNFDGTLSTAHALGFLDPATSELTDRGRRFALGSAEERRRIVLEAMLQFPPYDLLLEAIFDRGAKATPADWIETWWSTNDFGNSASNRSEGSSAFAQLVEFAGLGDYIRGRRGHPTRIEWKPNAEDIVRDARGLQTGRDDGDRTREPSARTLPSATLERQDDALTAQEYNNIRIVFGPGRVALLQAPPILTKDEKSRLLGALEYLIAVGRPDDMASPDPTRQVNNGDE